MRRAIITGATGAIGMALITRLINAKIEVLVLCRKDSRRVNNIPKHGLVTVKYCDLSQLKDLKNDTGKKYDVFYHLAWAGTTGKQRDDMYLQNENVRYSLDAVKAAYEFGCHTFVGAGSQAEYGSTNNKLKATTSTFPNMGYGYAKLCAGQMTRGLAKQLGLKHIWVRVLSVYGPNDNPVSMIPATINNFQKGIKPKFTKGEQLWDYLYSEDAANAFYLVGEKGKNGKIYVLGNGEARPLKEYILKLRDIVSPNMEIEFGEVPYSVNQIMYLCADISEIREDVGFIPQVSFEDGIKKTIEWVREYYKI